MAYSSAKSIIPILTEILSASALTTSMVKDKILNIIDPHAKTRHPTTPPTKVNPSTQPEIMGDQEKLAERFTDFSKAL